MSRRSRQEIIEEYGKSYRNYLARYRRAAKKYGEEYIPEKISRKAKKDIRASDIGIVERQRAGLFESVATEKGWTPKTERIYEDSRYRYESKERKTPSIVEKIIERLESQGDRFRFNATKVLYKGWVQEIKGAYTPEQIAYIYMEHIEDLEQLIEAILTSEDNYITNPQTLFYLEEMSKVFQVNLPDQMYAEEYFDTYDEFYDAGFEENWREERNFQ